jgi:hypothetical protein
VAQADKRLEAMRRNPAGDWRIEDIAAVCRAHGVECAAPARGSHFRIAHRDIAAILTIPARRPIKPVYVREFVAYIDEVEALDDHE